MADISGYGPMRPLSATRLAAFRRCEALFLLDDEREETAAQLVGKAAHCLVLEGREAYEARYSEEGPVNPKTGNPYGLDTKAMLEWQKETGFTVLGYKNAAIVEAMAASVKAHAEAQRLLEWGSPELWIEARVHGVDAHGRLDWLTGQAQLVIAEYKTCEDLDNFESDARRFGYIHQTAFYRSMLASKEGLSPLEIQCSFIVSEKSRLRRCGVWHIGQGVLGQAQLENEAAIERLKACWDRREFRTGFEEVRSFDWL